MAIKLANLLASLLMLAGCASVRVAPLKDKIDFICIMENKAVIVQDFLPAVISELNARNITAYVVGDELVPDNCAYMLTYTARKKWDFVMYMHTADLTIANPAGLIVASAHYDCGSGLNLAKFKSTETKVKMMMDDLLKDY